MIVGTVNFAFNLVDLVKDPESFDEAYNHPEADKKIMWRRAISEEMEANLGEISEVGDSQRTKLY
jgi:hypothetical protein